MLAHLVKCGRIVKKNSSIKHLSGVHELHWPRWQNISTARQKKAKAKRNTSVLSVINTCSWCTNEFNVRSTHTLEVFFFFKWGRLLAEVALQLVGAYCHWLLWYVFFLLLGSLPVWTWTANRNHLTWAEIWATFFHQTHNLCHSHTWAHTHTHTHVFGKGWQRSFG